MIEASLSKGKYKGKILTVGADIAKTKNLTPFIWFKFAVSNKYYPSENVWKQIVSKEIYVRLYISPGTKAFNGPKLTRLGFNGKWDGDANVSDESYAAEYELECKNKVWNGELREEWDLAGLGGDGIDDDSVRRGLGAWWKTQTEANGRQGPPPSVVVDEPTANRPTANELTADELEKEHYPAADGLPF